MARVLAVCNQKGGVGKTSVVTGLAEVFSRQLKKRVLVVDADPQRNSTTALGISKPELTLNDVLLGDTENNGKIIPGSAGQVIIPAGDAWQGPHFPQLDLIAAERNLAGRERDSMMARERRLYLALKGVIDDYDIVLIDCPPSLGLLTINALTAATHALLVSEPRVASVEGLAEIYLTIAEVQENLNEDLDLLGVVVNKVRKGRTDQQQWIDMMKANFEDLVFEPHLPDREYFSKSQAASRPLKSFGSGTNEVLADLAILATRIWDRSGQ